MKPFLTCSLLVLCCPAVAAAADAGSVLFATGDVMAERQPAVALGKGDAILDNDVIATGDASRAQLRLLDGAKIAIRPNSRLRIDEYVFAGTRDQDTGEVVATSGDRSVTTLIKGGLRTITGAIGKEDEAAYEVRTAVGVLGIRGTEYSAVFCNGDCDWVPGLNPNNPIADGLYLGVTEGSIFFRNENGDLELDAGEYAFIPLVGRVPAPLENAPPVLLDANDLQLDANNFAAQPGRDNAAQATGFDSRLGTRRAAEPASSKPDDDNSSTDPNDRAPEQPVNATDESGNSVDLTPGTVPPRPPGNRIIGYASGPLGRLNSTYSTVADNEPSQYSFDASDQLTGFSADYPAQSGATTADLSLGTSSNVDSGFDAMTVLRWGRWAGGSADVALPAGQTETIDLASTSLHWVSSTDDSTPVMPITGVASYSLVGATAPTDNLGNSGTLGSATFQANFTSLRVDSTLVIAINAQSWTATGSGNIGVAAQLPANFFSGSYSDVTVDGIGGGTGVFSGFFSAPGDVSDASFPGGVGLTYSLQDGAGSASVSGAAAFGNP